MGNVHPLARSEFEVGFAPLDLPLDRMLLVLKRSPEQEAALQQLLLDQQDKGSPRFRHWLSPQEFGAQFGVAEEDIRIVTGWLQAQGFHDLQVSKGRTIIEFSGTATQVQNSFKSPIRKYLVAGEEHWANSVDPSIPAALSPVVSGVFTIHNFYKRPQVHLEKKAYVAKARRAAHPEFTSTTGGHALAPADYYTIYNFNPLLISTSAKIAIVGRSNINLQDVTYFHFWTYDQAESAQVILNGTDPGDLGGDEELEAVLDTSWAGAVAPTAWVALVVSQSTSTTDGVDLSELYIIDNNLADVMSESFGTCEGNATSAEASGVSTLAQQAAAEGITYVVAAGDTGSAGCDSHDATTATHPLSVNLLASTPYTVAVGGTMFNENGHDSAYWTTTNAQATQESAISYIPEDVWNESCQSAQSGCSNPGILAGGGGPSALVKKPSWQGGVTGIPSDGARDVPDVSLTSAAHDPYLICLDNSCVPNSEGSISFAGVSGTSAATPAFAGIMALVGQKNLVRLGQPNFILYRLAAAENFSQCNGSNANLPAPTCVFNDVTIGNNAVPGEVGYGTSSALYLSGRGYDLASGLGSVSVTNLINQWDTVSFNPTTTAFSISPVSAQHGTPLNVIVNVAANSGTGKPTGVAWLLQSGYPTGNFIGDNIADVLTLDASGSFTGVSAQLPGGTYQVNAHYAGDGTYAASDSAPPVQVTIQSEPTTLTFSVLTPDATGNLIPIVSAPFGTAVYFQAHVGWASGYGKPSSYVNFWDNSLGIDQAYVDAKGNALSTANTQIPAGTHSITAGYYGDNSFSSSSDLTPVSFTITQVATSTILTSQQTQQSLLLTATVSATSAGIPASGTITFRSGNAVLGTSSLSGASGSNGLVQSTATFDASQLAPGSYSVSAVYSGDTNYLASSSTAVNLSLTADFSVANRGITSQTVSAGQTATYINDIGVTPFFGYSASVTLSCTVPATATVCSANPSSLSLSQGPNIASISITTTAPKASVLMRENRPRFAPMSSVSWQLFFLSLVSFAFLIQVGQNKRSRLTAIAGLLLLIGMSIVGCGGSGGSANTTPPPITGGTPAGTYTVTVSAVSGTTTHSTTLTLVVE
ncbi:MAG: Ig-like domain repeat protein [Candidatus Acidiferrum sp.]